MVKLLSEDLVKLKEIVEQLLKINGCLKEINDILTDMNFWEKYSSHSLLRRITFDVTDIDAAHTRAVATLSELFPEQNPQEKP